MGRGLSKADSPVADHVASPPASLFAGAISSRSFCGAACREMARRIFGAVSGALRSLVRKANAPAIPAAAHQERVRKAMESLAPPGRRLPSESKALAMELVAAAGPGGGEMPTKTPEEMYLAANALHLVRPEWQQGCVTLGC